jgi:HEAT repeat protein
MYRPTIARTLLAAGLLVAAAAPARGQDRDSFLDRPMTAWLGDLKDGQVSVRRSAAFALGKIGSLAPVPELVDALRDSDASVREASAFALGEIGPPPDGLDASPIVASLLRALSDVDPRVRRSAAYSLGRYRDRAAAAAQDLEKTLGDREPVVRQNAAWALGQLGPDAKKAVPALGRLLQEDKDVLVRRDAAQALGTIGHDAHSALSILLAHFKRDPDVVVRRTALSALVGVVGSEDTDQVGDELRKALNDPDPDVKEDAAFALANIGGPDATAALPILRKALKEDDDQGRRLAATALANIGQFALEAAGDLRDALGDPDREVRLSAALALGRMGPQASKALPALVKVLDPSQPEDVRKFAAEAIANIGPDDPQALAALLSVFGEKGNYYVKHRAVWALARLKDFEKREVVQALASALYESAPEAKLLRYEAAKTLALKLGPRVPDKTLDVLLEALRDNGVRIYQGTGAKVSSGGTEARTGEAEVKQTGAGDWRRIVAVALARVGPERIASEKERGPKIIEGLKQMAKDSPDEEARKAAEAALDVLKKG